MQFQSGKNSSESAKNGDNEAVFGGYAVSAQANFPAHTVNLPAHTVNFSCTYINLPCTHRFVELWIKIVDNCGNVNSFKERLRSFMYRNTLFSQYICRK